MARQNPRYYKHIEYANGNCLFFKVYTLDLLNKGTLWNSYGELTLLSTQQGSEFDRKTPLILLK